MLSLEWQQVVSDNQYTGKSLHSWMKIQNDVYLCKLANHSQRVKIFTEHKKQRPLPWSKERAFFNVH
jgi:hypothetical protein